MDASGSILESGAWQAEVSIVRSVLATIADGKSPDDASGVAVIKFAEEVTILVAVTPNRPTR